MKIRIINLLILLIISSLAFGGENEETIVLCDNPESITPSSAYLFAEISNIPVIIDLLNGNNQYSNLGNLIFNYKSKVTEFKNKTGVDLLNKESLKSAGFDIERSVYISAVKNTGNKDETVLFFPVINVKNFSLFFVKLLKKLNNDKPGADLNPAVSKYNNFRVYQIQPNIFYTFIKNYFILTQSGESLKAVIDLHTNGCESSLSENPYFVDYKKKSDVDNSGIFSIFINNNFIRSGLEQMTSAQKLPSNTETDPENLSEDSTKKTDENSRDEETFEKDQNFPVNYIAAEIKPDFNNITASFMISTNKDNKSAKLLAEMITTGLPGKLVPDDNLIGYYYLSFDFNKLNDYCKDLRNQNESICKSYQETIKSVLGKGINLEDAVFPCAKSFINIILNKSGNQGEMDNFVIFLPMKECDDVKDTFDALKESLGEKYPDDLSGEEKIDDFDSFWFINDNNSRINILNYNNDIYIGNNIDLIKRTIKYPYLNLSDIKSNFLKGMDSNTFLFSNSKFDDESFLKALLMMMAFRERPELFSLISKIESISFTGKKTGFDYNFLLKINMIAGKNK